MTLPRRNDKPAVAVVGATGLVGRELLSILATHRLGQGEVRLFASERSAGVTLSIGSRKLQVKQLTADGFRGIDVAFLCAGAPVSRQHARLSAEPGAVEIDRSSAFRMTQDVPLVVPEANADVLASWEPPGIIANPNCSTIIAAVAVTPLHRAAGIQRMVISTYQAASGAGAAVLEELEQQARDFAAGRSYTTRRIGRQYLCRPTRRDARSRTGRRRRPRASSRRVYPGSRFLEDELAGETGELDEDDARAILSAAPGVRVIDDRTANRFPEPIDATGRDEVLVGRIRADTSQPPGKGLSLFVAGDQLRKGAALNAAQIAEQDLGERLRTM